MVSRRVGRWPPASSAATARCNTPLISSREGQARYPPIVWSNGGSLRAVGAKTVPFPHGCACEDASPDGGNRRCRAPGVRRGGRRRAARGRQRGRRGGGGMPGVVGGRAAAD